jgi:hypothetical protein
MEQLLHTSGHNCAYRMERKTLRRAYQMYSQSKHFSTGNIVFVPDSATLGHGLLRYKL